jgi:hypothetical protein
MLREDLPRWGNGNITLIFLLSHGEPLKAPGTLADQDVMFMTSDTKKAAPSGTAILVGEEVATGAFKRLERGSTVWVFLDACFSGAVASPQLQIDQKIMDNIGAKVMVMAAAMPEDETYQAAFTRALLKIWETPSLDGPSCIEPPPLADKQEVQPYLLWKTMKSVLAESKISDDKKNLPLERGPRTLVPYNGDICLDSFSAQGGSILFYNTSNKTFDIEIRPAGGVANPQTKRRTIQPTSGDKVNVTQVKLDRGDFELQITSRSVGEEAPVSFTEMVNLAKEPVSFITLPPDRQIQRVRVEAQPAEVIRIDVADEAKRKAVAYEKAADNAYHGGASLSSVIRFKEIAELAYRQIGERVEAERIDSDIKGLIETEKVVPDWQIPNITALSTPQLIKIIEEKNINISDVARQFYLADRFDRAADLFTEAAKFSLDPARRFQLAEQAYFAYAAAGKANRARDILKEFEPASASVEEACVACVAIDDKAKAKSETLIKLQLLGKQNAIFGEVR